MRVLGLIHAWMLEWMAHGDVHGCACLGGQDVGDGEESGDDLLVDDGIPDDLYTQMHT